MSDLPKIEVWSHNAGQEEVFQISRGIIHIVQESVTPMSRQAAIGLHYPEGG